VPAGSVAGERPREETAGVEKRDKRLLGRNRERRIFVPALRQAYGLTTARARGIFGTAEAGLG
jgi:hypothetical protein